MKKKLCLFLAICLCIPFSSCRKAETPAAVRPVVADNAAYLQKTVFAENLKCVGSLSSWRSPSIACLHDKIYYVGNDGLYCFDRITESLQCVVDGIIASVHTDGENLYWVQVLSEEYATPCRYAIYMQKENRRAEKLWDNYRYYKQDAYYETLTPNCFCIGEDAIYLLLSTSLAVVDRRSEKLRKLSGSSMPLEKIALTADGELLGCDHNGPFNLWKIDPHSGAETLLRGEKATQEKRRTRLYENVFCRENDIFYNTRVPFAVWKMNNDQPDEKILDFGDMFYLFDFLDGGDYMYIIRRPWVGQTGSLVIYQYDYKKQAIIKETEFADLGNVKNADIVDGVLIAEVNGELIFRTLS